MSFIPNSETGIYKGVKLYINCSNKIYLILLDDIYYLEAQRSYSLLLYQPDKMILVSKPLLYFEKILPCDKFIRCHRSYIINIDKIDTVDKIRKEIKMINTSVIPLASRRFNLFNTLMKSGTLR